MKTSNKIILIFIFSSIQLAWSASSLPKSFDISAGKKKLSFQANARIEWSQFCFDDEMGCARFSYKREAKAPVFGYIKVVTDKLEEKDFAKYCKDVFALSYASDKKLKNFNMDSKVKIPHCSWMGVKDMIHFYWKNGITLVVNTNEQLDVQKIISEAKLK